MTKANPSKAKEIKKLWRRLMFWLISGILMLILLGLQLYLHNTADGRDPTYTVLLFLPVAFFDFYMVWHTKNQIKTKLAEDE